MKLLFKNKRYIVSIFLAILMVFCTSMSGYANIIPVFTDGDSTTRTIAENTASGTNIGTAVAATDADNDVLTYTLGGTDASAFRINENTGQLQTNVALDYETKSSYSVSVSASDGNGGSDSTAVTINVTNVNEKPSFNIFGRVTLSVAENTASGTNIGTPFQATDPDSGDTLTYSLQRDDKDAFRIDATTGQLRTHATLDYETKSSYSNLAVRATDSQGLVNSVLVTVNVTKVNENRAPAFNEGNSTTRSIAKNTSSNTNIGTAITATDADNDVLTYTLGGTDAASFSIVATSGQLRTNAALDDETKSSYSVSISVSDGNGGSDSIAVTINVTDVDETPANNAPSFTDGTNTTRSIAENTVSGTNIGSAVGATDTDTGNTLTYTLGGTDAASFSIVSTSGQLQTKAALNHEADDSYAVTVSVSDGNGGSDSIAVTISVTDVNEKPSFNISGRVTLSVAEHTTSGTNIGTPFQATDPDSGDTLTYSLQRGDKDSFRIDATTGQLRTHAALDYKTKRTYNDLAVRATDSQGLVNSVLVTINVTDVDETPANSAPIFTDGSSTTRSVAENTASGTNIGSAVSANDVDTGDTLTYTLGGTDASSFSIVSTSGQLQTNAALNYESTSSYSVSVSVSDGNGSSDSIPVTINVTNVNEAPTFATTTATRAIAENTATNQNIGAALTATDVDNGSTITYSIPTTGDAAAFSIDSNTGQLKTKNALNYEDKNAYTVVVTASDGNLSDTITVTISVTNVNEAPSFATGTTISNISATNGTAITSVTLPEATDVDANTTLTYTLTPALPAGLTFTASTRVLSGTPTAVSASATYTYTASDSNLSATLTFSIQVNAPANRAPTFTDGTSTTRSVAENTRSGRNIGSPVAATDADTGNTLTYTLGGADASSFSIVSTSGQLQTNAALNYESKSSYSVSVSVSDDNGGSDSIPVTINVTDVNEKPSFNIFGRVTLSVAENTVAGTNIGTPFQATDPDSGDTLTYSLQRGDKDAFRINENTGQLQTREALDYETKSSYSNLAVRATDSGGLVNSVLVTINVTDVNENRAPAFSEGNSATRSVAENTASGRNIGAAIAATDADSGDTLTYTLGGTDAAMFSIVSTSGQLRTNAALDYEVRASYFLTVSVSDGNGGGDSITVTINVTDVTEIPITPPLSERTPQVRDGIVAAAGVDSVGDVTPAHLAAIIFLNLSYQSISSLKAGDFNGLTSLTTLNLSYNSLSDISALSNLTTLTTLYLSYNSLSDISALSNLTALKALDLSGNPLSDISALSNLTTLTTLYLQINGMLGLSGISDISVLSNLTALRRLDLSGNSISDVSALEDLTGLTWLHLRNNLISDYGPLRRLKAANPNVRLDININNNSPVFTEGTSTTRSVAETTASGTNIGTAVAATDVDKDTLFYILGGTDAALFSIVGTSGQLQTKTSLDFETETSYTVTVIVYDGNAGGDRITVTINVADLNENNAPVFTDGSSTTRSVAENPTSGTNIGTAIAATDADNDTLTYSLGGTDADSFSIVSTSGQLQTRAPLNYEIKSSYSVTVSVSDGNGNINSITVTINVTDVTEAPITPVSDRTPQVRDAIVAKVPSVNNANDVTEAHLAAIISLDLSDQSISSLKAGDFDGLTPMSGLELNNNSINDISVLSNLTFLASLELHNNSISDISVLSNLTSLTGLKLSSNLISDISVLEDLTSLAFLELNNNSISDISALEDLTSLIGLYLAGNPIPDYGPLRRLKAANPDVDIDIDINNNPPVFTEGTSTTRSVVETTPPGTNIGTAIAATDTENDILTYTLGGTDADSFSIDSTTGQLQTSAALDYETKTSYTVTVDVSDGNGLDRITVTINVTNVAGAAPPVLPGTTALLPNFPNPFNPETWIPYQLAEPAEVTLTIYDIQGRVVRKLALGHQPAGVYRSRSRAAHWDGRNQLGEQVATGIYFYTLKAGDYMATRKLLIRK